MESFFIFYRRRKLLEWSKDWWKGILGFLYGIKVGIFSIFYGFIVGLYIIIRCFCVYIAKQKCDDRQKIKNFKKNYVDELT